MLNALLEKLGLKYESLTPVERETYQAWAETLSNQDVTVEDIRVFLAGESERAYGELKKWDNSPARELYYKALSNLTDNLRKFMAGPGAEREALKAHLKAVFHIDV
jgi:hypothetical protein